MFGNAVESLLPERSSFREQKIAAVLERHLFGEEWEELGVRLGRCQRLERVHRLIGSHFDDQTLTLSRAAQVCAVSKNHLNVLLLRATAKTFHALLTRYRLARAAGLLRRTDRSVLEISLACGFGSVSSFERNAKKIFGSPPRELRKTMVHCIDKWDRSSVPVWQSSSTTFGAHDHDTARSRSRQTRTLHVDLSATLLGAETGASEHEPSIDPRQQRMNPEDRGARAIRGTW